MYGSRASLLSTSRWGERLLWSRMADLLIFENALQRFGRWVFDDDVLEEVDAVVELFDHAERLIERAFEDAVKEMIAAVTQTVTGILEETRRALVR